MAAPRRPPQPGRLTSAVERWVADWNENPRPFVWHKTADQILNNLARYLNRIPNSGH